MVQTPIHGLSSLSGEVGGAGDATVQTILSIIPQNTWTTADIIQHSIIPIYIYTQTKQTVPYGLAFASNIPLTTEAPSLLLVIGFSALLAILDVTLASYLNTS